MKDTEDKKAGTLAPVKPGIFTDWSKIKKGDGRTREKKFLKSIVKGLLEFFPKSPPPAAQLIAGQASFKALSVMKFEHFVLSGGEPSETASAAYLTLSNSLRRDLETLSRMQKDGGPVEKTLNLPEYLAAKAKEEAERLAAAERVAVPVKAEPTPTVAAADKGNGGQTRKTLF